jgi:hypothetical protein
MKKEENNWSEYLKNMSRALEEMRVNYDRTMQLKNIENASNPLLSRRMEKKRQSIKKQPEATTQPQPATDQTTNGIIRKSPVVFKRMLSMPNPKTPLTAFYYTSNLKFDEVNDETFAKSFD